MSRNNKVKIADSAANINPCIMCNPKRYLKFSFAFVSYEKSEPKQIDLVKMWERMRWMSKDTFANMTYLYRGDKSKWFEQIPLNQIRKEVPSKFREIFPTESNEEYWIMRVYPAGTPKETANPRIIGMVKHTIFYIFYLDWEGKLYSHGR